jgi:hypothetical protein
MEILLILIILLVIYIKFFGEKAQALKHAKEAQNIFAELNKKQKGIVPLTNDEQEKLEEQKKDWNEPADAKMVAELNIILHPQNDYYFENNSDGKGMIWLRQKEDHEEYDLVREVGFAREKDPKTFYFIGKNGNLYSSKSEKYRKLDVVALELKRQEDLKIKIRNILIEKSVKVSVNDIDTLLMHDNRDEVETLCKEMYKDGQIDFAGNSRYFVENVVKKKSKANKASEAKSESTDIPGQIKKLSDLKDQGILNEEEFQIKKKDLLDKM